MNEIPFSKYQGTGNDFVLIDQQSERWLTRQDTAPVRQLCDRRFGIGADGLILLQSIAGFDFEMIYFNSDGRESTMCGNGGRCIAAFAKRLGIVEKNCRFLAIDGPHEAIVADHWVELKMTDVASVETGDGYFVLDTGSPHYVVFVEDLSDIDIVQNGQAIRYSDRFRKDGINVNFVEKSPAGIEVATYERGVEDETLSCGTGVVAAALAWFLNQPQPAEKEVDVSTKGGNLKVRFKPDGQGGFSDVWLCGPATAVFEGKISI
ncbi:MAG: diaminopimelate epimerase [Bacteroidetes bacterium]|nr:diaminopimelate epimerase [Bacteroidota bacterium]